MTVIALPQVEQRTAAGQWLTQFETYDDVNKAVRDFIFGVRPCPQGATFDTYRVRSPDEYTVTGRWLLSFADGSEVGTWFKFSG